MRERRSKVEKPKEQNPKTRKQLGVQVDIDQWRRFRTLAFQKGRTAGDLLKEVLEEYLKNYEMKG